MLLLKECVNAFPVGFDAGTLGPGIQPIMDFRIREFEKRLKIRSGRSGHLVDKAVGGSCLKTDFFVAETVTQQVQYRSHGSHSNFPSHLRILISIGTI